LPSSSNQFWVAPSIEAKAICSGPRNKIQDVAYSFISMACFRRGSKLDVPEILVFRE
jgi:hypothetical protein